MKQFIHFFVLCACLLFAGTEAFALGGPSTPSGGGSGRPRCAVYDTGWEEHGNHNSCGECKAIHQECVERCYTYSYTCKATGTDANGLKHEFQAIDRSERYASDRALDRCYGAGLMSCSVSTCSESSDLMSSRSCQ